MLRSRERDGDGWRRTGLFGKPGGIPMSESRRLLADMLMMMNSRVNVFQKKNLVLSHLFICSGPGSLTIFLRASGSCPTQ